MTTITQEAAVNKDSLSQQDQVNFWRDPRWDDLECLHATFVNHSYAPHTHDTYVMGVIEQGVECYRLKGINRRAVAGDVCVVNPGELHDGRPGDNGYRYRMFYPSVSLISGISEQVTERPGGEVHFNNALFRDDEVGRLLAGAHRALQTSPQTLERDSALTEAATLLVKRYGELRGPIITIGREAVAIQRVCDYIQDNLDLDLDLNALAQLVGFSPYRLIRSFRAEKGITPHAWVIGCRVKRAKDCLAQGQTPADVAAACGFYDQAHMTRHFKGTMGVTPGKYRAAFLQ
ncbi:MAG: AraC family transcriptional regulator [Alphaproteobacteria bacterium]|nr:AraC family transcriptional regulator [Alphaproteobacteria bacterium]